jgi:predicted amidohydrolase
MRQIALDPTNEGVDLLLFPECFLQGYLVDPSHLDRWAIPIDSAAFAEVRAGLADVNPTLVFGMIERDGERFRNTAVVLRHGELVSVYRKAHLTPGEAPFAPGTHYPVFDQGGVRFGINICHDANFPESAAQVAADGANVLLLPSQNMMLRRNAETWKDRHIEIRAERARETSMWVASADVTGSRDADRIGWGPTCVIDPTGEVVAQVPLGAVGVAVVEIPSRSQS